jgi:hypothetical protein
VSYSSGRSVDHIEHTILLVLGVLPSKGCCLQSHCLATALYATVSNMPQTLNTVQCSIHRINYLLLQTFREPPLQACPLEFQYATLQ